MAKFDYSHAAPERPEGWTACVVKDAEETTSKKTGHRMFAIKLETADGRFEIRDWIMFAGPAAKWHSRKVKAILARDEPPGPDEDIDPADLIDRRCWAYIVQEQSGKYQNDKVDGNVKESDCGYLYEGAMPWPGEGEAASVGGDVAKSQKEADDADFDDIPF